jgi:glycosyltransferase involved in cell wall biosynthesis
MPWLSLLVMLAWVIIVAFNLPDLLRLPWLPADAGAVSCGGDGGSMPWVSVILPARNEANRLEETLSAWARQRYPAFEVLVVDDRSEDATGEIIDRYSAVDPRFRAIHVDSLPPGWLGKNYALHLAAQQARGEWLLFADADVRFAPDALARAMAYVSSHRIDHLTMAPTLLARGYWLRALTALFVFNLLLFKRPHSAYRRQSRAYAGIGAFNLLRREVYVGIGGHQSIALRPDDDIQLGRLVKRAGYHQQFALAENFMFIEWYPSLVEMFRGLEKSPLAAFRYSVGRLLVSMIPLILLYEGPFAAVLCAPGAWRLAGAAALALMFCLYALQNRFLHYPLHQFFVLPVTLCLFIYTFVRAGWLAIYRGGLLWRGTLYPLAELRRGL